MAHRCARVRRLMCWPCCIAVTVRLRRDAAGNDRRLFMLETAFWEAVAALTSEGDSATRPPPCVPTDGCRSFCCSCMTSALLTRSCRAHVSEALEALAFEALFAAADDGPRAAAAARALGRLSQRRYNAIFARVLHELDSRLRVDTPTARLEVSGLAGALEYLHLPVRWHFGVFSHLC